MRAILKAYIVNSSAGGTGEPAPVVDSFDGGSASVQGADSFNGGSASTVGTDTFDGGSSI